MMRFALTGLLCCIAASSYEQQPARIKSFAEEYSTLTISQEAIQSVVSSIEFYVTESEKRIDSTGEVQIEVRLVYDRKIDSARSFKEVQAWTLNKPYYTSFNFWYTCENDSAPISKVLIYFENFNRRVEITGTDRKKTKALLGEIDVIVRASNIATSSVHFPPVLYFILSLSSLGVVSFTGYVHRKVQTLLMRIGLYIFASVFVVLALTAGVLIGDYSHELFPRTIITTDHTSWYFKDISFINFCILTICIVAVTGGCLICIDTMRRKKKKKTSLDASVEEINDHN